MQSKELLTMLMNAAVPYVRDLIADMADAPLTSPTPRGGNHPLWLLGHLTVGEGLLIQEWILGEENPAGEWRDVFGSGTEPVGDSSRYPPFAAVMARSRAVHERTMKLLASMSEEDLDRETTNVPEEFRHIFPTRRHCFMMVAFHWLEHRGQIADARRAAGRKRMFY